MKTIIEARLRESHILAEGVEFTQPSLNNFPRVCMCTVSNCRTINFQAELSPNISSACFRSLDKSESVTPCASDAQITCACARHSCALDPKGMHGWKRPVLTTKYLEERKGYHESNVGCVCIGQKQAQFSCWVLRRNILLIKREDS